MSKQIYQQTQLSPQSDQKHCFQLKKKLQFKLKNSIPKSTLIDFTPSLTNPHQLNPQKKKYVKTIPNYNKDGLYYTSAFIIPHFDNFTTAKKRKLYEKFKYENFNAHMEKMLQLANSRHSQKKNRKILKQQKDIIGVKDSKQNITTQKPIRFDPGKESYCAVCSLSFGDYWLHVNSATHQRAISKNQANKFIHQLCQQYRPQLITPILQNSLQSQKIYSKSTMYGSVSQENENIHTSRINKNFFKVEIPFQRPKSHIPCQTVMPQKHCNMSYCSQIQPSYQGRNVANKEQYEYPQQKQQNFDMLFNFQNNLMADDYEIAAQKNGIWDRLFDSEINCGSGFQKMDRIEQY